MTISNTYEAAILAHIYQNVAITGLGDAAGVLPSAVAGTIKVALHSSDPGDTGSQTTNEVAYTSYARATVARASGAGGFTLSGTSPTQIANTSVLSWPMCTGGTDTATHFSFGDDDGDIIHSGALNAPLLIANLITPTAAAGALVATQD